MRITNENGKRYRAYSPEEFFKTPENSQLTFYVNEPKPKRTAMKEFDDKIIQKAD